MKKIITIIFLISYSTFGQILNEKERANKINALRVSQIIAWIAIPIQLIVAWQGLWLIHSGYSFDLSADPETLGRNAARGRGVGGLVILIIMFLPYLLTGGFSFLACKTFAFANNELPRKLKRLKDHEKELKSMSVERRQQCTEEMQEAIDKSDYNDRRRKGEVGFEKPWDDRNSNEES